MYTCAQETWTFQCTCTIDRPHRLWTSCIKKVNVWGETDVCKKYKIVNFTELLPTRTDQSSFNIVSKGQLHWQNKAFCTIWLQDRSLEVFVTHKTLNNRDVNLYSEVLCFVKLRYVSLWVPLWPFFFVALFQVLYDGLCPICVTEIQFLQFLQRKKPEKVDFVDIAQPGYDGRKYKEITYEMAMEEMHVIDKEDKVSTDSPIFSHHLS